MSNNSVQQTAHRAAADAGRSAGDRRCRKGACPLPEATHKPTEKGMSDMHLFVYGPYMNPEYLREKDIAILGAARGILRGYDICFSTRTGDWKHAMIDLKESQGKQIEGVLYTITDDAMGIFDNHEKIAQKKHGRIEVQVQRADGTLVRASTFVSPIKEGDFVPSAEYLKVIAQGAELHGLSKEYINHILSFGDLHQKR